ncbi:surfactant protein B [Ostertagia ostertagi]
MKLLILVAAVVVAFAEPIHRSNELPTMCSLCNDAVNVVVKMMDRSLPEIENVFIIQCSELLSFLPFGGMECQQIAHGKIPKIKEFLESGTAAKDVCSKLKAC